MKGYDYAQAGAYYITICTYERECMFGQIENGEMILNEQGKISNDEWLETFVIRKNTELDVFVVMPNHIHGIIVITHHDNSRRGVLHTPNDLNNEQNRKIKNIRGVCNTPLQSPSETVGAIVRGFKSSVTSKINLLNHCKGFSVWQRNFHDHIIRDHASYLTISKYIVENPANWRDDVLFKE
jgi:REP element-mobilizing transposase RayT